MPLPRLTSGVLRHRIRIVRQSDVPDGKGGYVTTWPEVAKARAEVLGLDGRESVMDRVLQDISTFRLRIRWRSGIKGADRIEWNGLDLNVISAVDPNGDREQLVIMADTSSPRVS